MKHYVTTEGVGDDLNPKQIFLRMERDTPDCITGKGSNLTKGAVKTLVIDGVWDPMLKQFSTLLSDIEKQTLLDTNLAITFGKETLLHLLSQKGCEGIRFYFCKTPTGKSSLVGVGIDADDNDIGTVDKLLPLDNNQQPRVSIKLNESDTEVTEEVYAIEVGPPITLSVVLTEKAKFPSDGTHPNTFLEKTGKYFESLQSLIQ